VNSVLHQPLSFVDIETTGGSHFNSRVLEVGVVRVEQSQVIATYKTLVHPDEDVPGWITGLTGITNEDVSQAPRFAEIAPELAEILEDSVFVAHNVRFDYSFLKMEFDRLGVPFKPLLLCTVKLSRRLYPESTGHKLADLIIRHQLVAPSRHRAYDDAHCLWQFYQLILREFDLDTIETAIRSQFKTPSIPSQLNRAQIDRLPDGPGVYIFENDEGIVLYVGKSVTIKRRVLGHFSSDYERGGEMKLASLVKHIRATETHGELGALLLESSLIKELQPLYNRMSRQRASVNIMLSGTSPEGYSTVRIEDMTNITSQEGARLLGVYTTAALAKQSLNTLTKNYGLCPKLMGLEHAIGACFQFQLHRCLGACLGQENVSSYNERFAAAFERQLVATWPYNGSVLIRESTPSLAGSAGFVVDNWSLLTSLRELEDGTVETEEISDRFDLDTYRILKRYIDSPGNRLRISPLSEGEMRALIGSGWSSATA
jgi:DNA polymerase-3 subunit epsilon